MYSLNAVRVFFEFKMGHCGASFFTVSGQTVNPMRGSFRKVSFLVRSRTLSIYSFKSYKFPERFTLLCIHVSRVGCHEQMHRQTCKESYRDILRKGDMKKKAKDNSASYECDARSILFKIHINIDMFGFLSIRIFKSLQRISRRLWKNITNVVFR